jgi:hypothetical protein
MFPQLGHLIAKFAKYKQRRFCRFFVLLSIDPASVQDDAAMQPT